MADSSQGASPKARPILFTGPMVRALLDGRKTQTRRIIKPQPVIDGGWDGPPEWALFWRENEDDLSPKEMSRLCPYGKPGDLLWVRETFGMLSNQVIYRAGPHPGGIVGYCLNSGWKPSIHMPRWASRLTLEITEVRVQRLQEISEADAIAEGIDSQLDSRRFFANYGPGAPYYDCPIDSYASLWNSINGPGSWNTTPWVWALTFRVHQQNVDTLLKARAA